MSFASDYISDARTASGQTGVWPGVILAQWSLETGHGSSYAFQVQNNYAGVSVAGGINSFQSKAAGLAAYIETLNLSYYDGVRAAKNSGAVAQMIALGASPWAATHYDQADWIAVGSPQDGRWNPPHPGQDLIAVYNSDNLSQYDKGAPPSGPGNGPADPLGNKVPKLLWQLFPTLAVGKAIQEPALGWMSDLQQNNFFINGTNMDVFLRDSLVVPQIDFDITKATTLTLTIEDPDRVLIASDLFASKALLTLGSTYTYTPNGQPAQPGGKAEFLPLIENTFSLVSVEKQANVLTATFEPYVVSALRTAVGPVTAAAGTMTRTQFAEMLIMQVVGAQPWIPPESYLYALDAGYARNTQEQISRGTTTNPLEDSWTCLQRLASEIGFICFEVLGRVYFGNEGYLVTQPSVFTAYEGSGGVDSVDGTYDIGQTDATVTINASIDTWYAGLGDVIYVPNLGPFSGSWLVTAISRENMLEPDLVITGSQPAPSMPEPTSGGAQAAVGAGTTRGAASTQTQGGSTAAQGAVNFCKAQLGKPYVWGGSGPSGFDCSGLVAAAYATQGISLPHNTVAMWDDTSVAHVPAGIRNLKPGDCPLFDGGDPPYPGHIGIIVSVDVGRNSVQIIDAYGTGFGIRYDNFTPNDGGDSNFAGKYWGSIRPAP